MRRMKAQEIVDQQAHFEAGARALDQRVDERSTRVVVSDHEGDDSNRMLSAANLVEERLIGQHAVIQPEHALQRRPGARLERSAPCVRVEGTLPLDALLQLATTEAQVQRDTDVWNQYDGEQPGDRVTDWPAALTKQRCHQHQYQQVAGDRHHVVRQEPVRLEQVHSFARSQPALAQPSVSAWSRSWP